jgi:hypothetical protein
MIFNSRKEDFLAVHARHSRPPSTIELRCQCVILTSVIFNLLYAIALTTGNPSAEFTTIIYKH